MDCSEERRKHILVGVKAKWGFGPAVAGGPSQSQKERLKKLAQRIDALARKDESTIEKAREIAALRRKAALDLYGICADFVRGLNELLARTELEFDPDDYRPDSFQEHGIHLFQINARGRILQIRFEATEELVSTEDFRVPYVLQGAVRCFNQRLLDQDLIEEQLLFYTIEKRRTMWRFFDARTHRSGPFDADYLTGLLEQLV
jgi:hypothetical protein